MPAASNQPSSPVPNKPLNKPCQHPRVQVVARNDDQEFVECMECREVFESSELRDMSLEENVSEDEAS